MGLSRRTGARFQAAIWPGFVDAMTGLLLVLMFVLTIFMVVQFVLRETISGQEAELNDLAGEVAALAQALGLEEQRGNQLDSRVNALNTTLNDARDQVTTQADLINSLTLERDAQAQQLSVANSQITAFEAQVAGLLSQREDTLVAIADLETEQSRLVSEQEALNLALAQNRTEIDAQTEAARLAASQRAALDALIDDLRIQGAKANDRVLALEGQLAATATALSDQEAAKLVEAAAAEALRKRLENADSELTAMTLLLDEKRREAEDTLTLLAAARSAQGDLNAQLIALLSQAETGASKSEQLQADLFAAQQAQALVTADLTATGQNVVQLQAQLQTAEQETASLRAQLDLTDQSAADLQAQLGAATQRISALQGQVALGDQNTADVQAQLTAALAAKLASEQALDTVGVDADEVRKQLMAALAAKLQSEQTSRDLLTAAQQRSALLENAQNALSDERQTSLEAQRQTELLNQQVAALRTQLKDLSGLLDLAKSRDQETQVQLQSLGSDLNTALARAVAEERRRRILEESERKRLEAATQDLEQYRSEFFGRLRDLLGNQDGVRIEGDRFVFSSEVLFPPGGADLSRLGEWEISIIASILRVIADEFPAEINWIIRVDCLTDNIPLYFAW
jgi:chemotaxis protein MotB